MSPAKINLHHSSRWTREAKVFLKADQVSLAIGKGGHNIKLAGRADRITRSMSTAKKKTEIDDVELKEFADEIDAWIIEVSEDRMRHSPLGS